MCINTEGTEDIPLAIIPGEVKLSALSRCLYSIEALSSLAKENRATSLQLWRHISFMDRSITVTSFQLTLSVFPSEQSKISDWNCKIKIN